jgi:hypothetical protein
MRHFLLLMGFLVAGGCVTRKAEPSQAAPAFPKDAFIIQRGVLTARGKQFTLNGYLSLSEKRGKRLIIMENFGSVLADVLVKPDGAIHVMRSSAAFPPQWIRRFVAADLQCITRGTPEKKCRVEVLSPTHMIVKRFWYSLDLHTLEIKAGEQPARMFDETQATP